MNFFSTRLFLPRSRIRHPFFPGLSSAPAAKARGRPAVLVGTFSELARAGARSVGARRAVYVLIREDEYLSDGERDELWRLFEVPIYALLVTPAGRVVAWECEAQNGLHIAEGGSGSACACGRPGAKLMLAGPQAHAAD
jgi:hypothetical protein